MSGSLPYPGLRPFRSDESYILFGREEHTDELLARLARTRFLAVVGPSGCGKSSLVRAGMIAGLETGFVASAGAQWRVATLRPGSHPLRRLAAALMEDEALGPKLTDEPHAQALIHATLKRGPLGLVEVLRETPLEKQTNLLILVDQFEELFRYQDGRTSDEAQAFVALLLESAAQEASPIFVVLTMRSDFLGDCARFTGLPEAMNDSQYLTPRLTREQRQAAIEGPARVFGGEVEPALVNAILNDMGSDPDQLPLMQHALMRMWIDASRSAPETSERSLSCRLTLRLKAYEDAGRLRTRLSSDADEALNELDPARQAIAETMFRILTERGHQERDLRRPAPIAEIAAVAGLPQEDHTRIADVVEVFRRPDRSFVTPTAGEPLFETTVLDISHESLIRQWQKLAGWVEDEAKSAWLYGRLREQADLWANGRGALWTTPDLENGLAWKQTAKPTREWAKRYGGDFDQAMGFLESSRRAQTRVHRRKITGISLAFAAITFATVVAFRQASEAGHQKNQAELRATLNEGFKSLDEDPERSLLLALHVADRMPSTHDRLAGDMEDLLHRAVQASRLRSVVSGQANPIQDIAYSPDGRRLAVAGVGGQAQVVDAQSGRTIVSLEGHESDVLSIAFSPDGNLLVTGSRDTSAAVWDAATGRQLSSFAKHHQTVGRAVFSPDGKTVVTASADSTAKIWEALTGKLRFDLRGHKNFVWGVAVSPDGAVIATASLDSTVKLWDARRGVLLRTLTSPTEGLFSVAFSPDGKRIAGGGVDGMVRVWDATTGEQIGTSSGHTRAVWDVVFSPDGTRIATASYDGTIRIWSAESGGQQLEPLTDSVVASAMSAVAFSPDGSELAGAGDDGKIIFWRSSSGETLRSFSVGAASIYALALSPDAMTVVTAGNSQAAEFWDLDTGTPLGKPLRGHTDRLADVAFSRDGSWIATASADGTARVWDAKERTELRRLAGHTGSTLAVCFGKERTRIVTGGLDGKVVVWDVLTGDSLFSLAFGGPVLSVQYSPDGSRIAAGGANGKLTMWDAVHRRRLFTVRSDTITGQTNPFVPDVDFSPDGRRIATANWGDQTVKVWDAASGHLLLTLVGHAGAVMTVAFNNDGRRIASAGYDQKIRVWDAQTGREIFRLAGHTGEVFGVAFTPDGDQLVSVGRDGTWRRWDLTSNTDWGSLRVDVGPLDQIAYSPDGRRLATLANRGVVKVWDARSGDSLRTLGGEYAWGFAFSPDGGRMAISDFSGTAVWDVSSGEQRVALSRRSAALSLAFSADGRRIATVGPDSAVRLWDASSGGEVGSAIKHREWVYAVSFSPTDSTRVATGSKDGTGFVLKLKGARRDTLWNLVGHKLGIRDLAFDPTGTRLASGDGDGMIRVWNAASGEVVIPPIKAHEAEVRKIAFNPDGDRIASSSRDGKTRVWDARTGEQLFTDSTSGQVAWLTFTPDSTRLAVAGTDGTVRFYSATLDDLLALARTHATRSLTEEECRVYLRADKCPSSVVDQIVRGKELARSGQDSGAASSFAAAVVSGARMDGDRRATSRYLLTQGEAFASQGNVPAAMASFRAAKQFDPDRSIDPERLARKKAADYSVTRSLALRRSGDVDAAKERLRRADSLDPTRELLARARSLADSGKVDSALVLFRRARELDPERDRSSEVQLVVSRAVSLTRAVTDSIATAISMYRTAVALDSSQLSADQWNSLCWYGTLWGHAQLVMYACVRAVALAGPDIAGDARDSRGLALAAMGRRDEAIPDFEAFIDQSTNHADRLLRQTWVDRLRAGKNPFSAEVLQALRIVDLADGPAGSLVTQYRNAIRLYPELLTAHFRLAEAYQSQGNNEGVIREYRTIDSLGLTYRPTENSIVVYRGSVTRQGSRGQPATFEVRFERMEPIFAGSIVVGEPLYGSGPFNAIWKGDSLVFWSTAATGDTIRWAAQPTLEEMSGKYEIFGGVAAGQRGVWRSRQTKGAPLGKMQSASTNATPASGPSGAWSGQWNGDGYSYGLDMTVKLSADRTAWASLVWTLKVSPEQSDSARIGHSATEFVEGSYDSQRRTLSVSGFGKEDPDSLISVDRYRLSLSADGRTLSGTNWNRGKWDGRFEATRKPR